MYALARIAFGIFLFQIGEEEDAVKQWINASRLDSANPNPWNNLAHYYSHRGPVKKAFRNYKTRLVRKLDNKTSDAGNSPTAAAKSTKVR
jgi:Tfp pilus assembly protein PilF